MTKQKQASPKEMRWIGALCAGIGLYFMLIGFGVFPTPGGPDALHAPPWVAELAGLVFFLGGVAVLVQALGQANVRGELPAHAPRWMRVVQYLIVLTIFASFALLGSFVAIGGNPRQFSSNITFVSGATNVSIARVAFGIGAIICWLATFGFGLQGARKIFGKDKSTVSR